MLPYADNGEIDTKGSTDMPEKIYTIPVNEAFDASAEDASNGCPFCSLYNMLEENELETILGASMMEPDIRQRTNAEGFCATHYHMMFERKNRLGLALILESHLEEVRKGQAGSLLSTLRAPGADAEKKLSTLESSCYVCSRIGQAFEKMLDCSVYLWETEKAFREKTAAQPYFCLIHYRKFMEAGRKRMGKKVFQSFFDAISATEKAALDQLQEDVSWFCKKFDYRYQDEPWYNAKDAVERAIRLLSGDLHSPKK